MGVHNQITAFGRIVFLSETCWDHFIGNHLDGYCILDNPNHNPGEPHTLIYDPAIIGASTAAYLECTLILDNIQALHIDGQKTHSKWLLLWVISSSTTEFVT